jgi:Vacuolar sorting protein 9 (VPS9) domain/GTPase-activator protein for Ras-like GTPase
MMVCGQLIHAVLKSLPMLPHGIRYVAKLVASMSDDGKSDQGQGEESDDTSHSGWTPRLRSVSDFLFINWVVNAIMFPENHQLSGPRPISQNARRNLQVVGTVLIKLMSGSRFTAFQQQHLAVLNQFLDELEPRMQSFLSKLLQVALPSEYYESEQLVDPMHRQFPIALLPNDTFAIHALMSTLYLKDGHASAVLTPPPPPGAAPSANQWSSPPPRTSPLPSPPRTPDSRRTSFAAAATMSASSSATSIVGPAFEFNEDEKKLADFLVTIPLPSLFHMPEPDSNDEMESIRNILSRAGAIPNLTRADENSYQMVDIGPALRDILTNDSDSARDSMVYSADESKVRNLLVTTVTACELDQETEANASETMCTLLDVVRSQARLMSLRGDVARASVLFQTLAFFPRLTPQHLQMNGYVPLIDMLIDEQQRAFDRLSMSAQAQRLSESLGYVNTLIERIHARERAFHTAVHQLKVRRVIECSAARIRALVKHFQKNELKLVATAHQAAADWIQRLPPSHQGRAAWQNTVRGSTSCRGPCPRMLDHDRFLCVKCDELLTALQRNISSFLSKYVVTPTQKLLHDKSSSNSLDLLDRLSSPLNVNRPHTLSQITDFVVSAVHEQIFVHCRMGDDAFYQMLLQLEKHFDDFESFFTAAHDTDDERKVEHSTGSRRNSGIGSTPQAPMPMPSPRRAVRVPLLGQETIDAAVHELNRINKVRSLSDKLEAFVNCQSVITNVLQNTRTLIGNEHSGADEYMPVLCYIIMIANPVRFLSNVQFVQVMDPNSMAVKGFVDTLVAIKYLVNLSQSINDAEMAEAAEAAEAAAGSDVASRGTGNAAALARLSLQFEDMGFSKTDVALVLTILPEIASADDFKVDRGFTKALDCLSNLVRMKEMGFTSEISVQALQLSDLNVDAAILFIQQQEEQLEALHVSDDQGIADTTETPMVDPNAN